MMQFIEKVRQKLGSYFWERQYKKNRECGFVSLQEAKSILILYDSEEIENYPFVKRFKEQLSQLSQARITSVGYNSMGVMQQDYIGTPSDFLLSKVDFSFFYMPKNSLIKDILEAKYDMLMLLSARYVFPLVMLNKYASATFKVGRNNVCDDLDFMIDVPSEKSLEVIGNHIITNLEMLKPKNKA
jgi:hypothetical protein